MAKQNPGYFDADLDVFGDSWERMERELEEEVDQTIEDHNLPNYFDDYSVEKLPGRAYAATREVPSEVSLLQDDDPFELLARSDQLVIDREGNIYGLEIEETDTEYVADPLYLESPEDVQELIELHEAQHMMQNNGRWGDELYSSGWIDDEEVREYLNLVDEKGDEALMEGTTELVTEKRLPDGERIGKRFYPEETRMAERIAEYHGADLESVNGAVDINDVSSDYRSTHIVS